MSDKIKLSKKEMSVLIIYTILFFASLVLIEIGCICKSFVLIYIGSGIGIVCVSVDLIKELVKVKEHVKHLRTTDEKAVRMYFGYIAVKIFCNLLEIAAFLLLLFVAMEWKFVILIPYVILCAKLFELGVQLLSAKKMVDNIDFDEQ